MSPIEDHDSAQNSDTEHRCRSCGKLLAKGDLASATLHIKCGRCGELNSVFEGMTDQVVVTSPDGVILYANGLVEDITGYPLSEVIGKTPALWGKQMPQDFYAALWHQIKELKQSASVMVKNRRRDGTIYHAQLRISPILDAAGEVKLYVGIETVIPSDKIS